MKFSDATLPALFLIFSVEKSLAANDISRNLVAFQSIAGYAPTSLVRSKYDFLLDLSLGL